jgi:signal transduction histidine kinase/HAMP domain-containing protein
MARRLRIRTKMIIWLFIAGVLPLGVASFYSLRVVRSRVDDNLAKETDRSLRIGLNLVLTWVERISDDAERLGRDPLLRQALHRYTAGGSTDAARLRRQVKRILARYRHRIAFGEVVLVDRRDRVITREIVGDVRKSKVAKGKKAAAAQSLLPKVQRNRFLHAVDIVPGPLYPVVRAMAPVIDEDFEVLGTVFVLVPLDHRFADVIRATLGMHVGFYLGRKPAASSFHDERGRSIRGLVLADGLLDRVFAGKSRVGVASAGNTKYSVGALPLVNAHQRTVGMFYVALDRKALEAGKLRSYRSLLLFGAGVFLLAFLIATYASRDLSQPLVKLHARAMAVGKGNLDGRIGLEPGDELGDLGKAFDDMTDSLRENQRRLGARISEIVTLHSIGRAVSSVVGLAEVLRTVVEEIRQALHAGSMSILLADRSGRLVYGAQVKGGTADGDDSGSEPEPDESEDAAGQSVISVGEGSGSGVLTGGRAIAQAVFRGDSALCVDDIEDHAELGEFAAQEGVTGSLMVVPLEHKGQRLGVMMINRASPPFGEAELRLLSTFADQASTAIENARLYEEVTVFNERLEQMVGERTAEISQTNQDLADALRELQEAQSQLLLSERLAGMGQLVAGIAHEVNTPAAAIQGAVANLDRSLLRLMDYCRQLANLGLSVPHWNAFIDEVTHHAARTELRQSTTAAEARKKSGDLGDQLEACGVSDARRMARRMVDLGASDSAVRLLELAGPTDAVPLIGCLLELVMLRRNGLAISTAISTVNRIVSALRAYSHLDQTSVDTVNLHDGIETTLIILGSRLRHGVTVVRRFGDLPQVPVYVDELNQVWTNLIVNGVDAIGEKGELVIESELLGDEVVVRILDDGPGIPDALQQRIFKPFFTTKAKGKGTGLGLGIVQRIVEKHGGRLEAKSTPGRTCFSVYLPVGGPPPLKELPGKLEVLEAPPTAQSGMYSAVRRPSGALPRARSDSRGRLRSSSGQRSTLAGRRPTGPLPTIPPELEDEEE